MQFFHKFEYKGEENRLGGFKQALLNYRVLQFSGFPPDDDMERRFAELAMRGGQFLNKSENEATAEMVADNWLDIRYDAKKATSFRHSNTRQPLHTDTSYTDIDLDIIFFFCRQTASEGGATTFIDGVEVIRHLREYDEQLYSELINTTVLYEKGGNKFREVPVISMQNGYPEFNWNHFRISASNSEAVKAMCLRFHEFCEKILVAGDHLLPLRLQPGEAVFFHDRKILHGRNAFSGDRCLLKGAIKLSPVLT